MAHRLHKGEAVAVIVAHQTVGNQPLQFLCQEPNHVISNILSVNAVDLLEIVNIHHNNLVRCFRVGIEQKTCMVEECLTGIKARLGIKLNF